MANATTTTTAVATRAADGCQLARGDHGRIIGHVRPERTGGWRWHTGRGQSVEATKRQAIERITWWREFRASVRAHAAQILAAYPAGPRVELLDLRPGDDVWLPMKLTAPDLVPLVERWKRVLVERVVDCGTGAFVVSYRGDIRLEPLLITDTYARHGAIRVPLSPQKG